LTPDDLPGLAKYDKDNPVSVVDRGEKVNIEPRFDPELHFELKKRSRSIAASLEALEVEDGEIRLSRAHRMFMMKSYENLTLPEDEIKSISLTLSGHVPPDWDPEWGLVFWLLGPTGYIGVGAQWYATDWLVLDAGTGFAYFSITGMLGFRFLPVRWRLKPFVGASATGIVFFDSSSEETGTIAGRLGFDIAFYNNRMLLRWEVNVHYFLNGDTWPITKIEMDRVGPASRYVPWTGFAVVILY
jgi:hypothetical protein